MRFHVAADHILQRCRAEEIFLLQAQFSSLDDIVIRVKDFGDRFGFLLILYRFNVVAVIKIIEIKFASGFCGPEPEVIYRIVSVTGDRGIVCHCEDIFRIDPSGFQGTVFCFVFHNTSVKFHGIQIFRPLDFPDVAVAKPVVGCFYLIPVTDVLVENSIFVPDSVAVSGQFHSRH